MVNDNAARRYRRPDRHAFFRGDLRSDTTVDNRYAANATLLAARGLGRFWNSLQWPDWLNRRLLLLLLRLRTEGLKLWWTLCLATLRSGTIAGHGIIDHAIDDAPHRPEVGIHRQTARLETFGGTSYKHVARNLCRNAGLCHTFRSSIGCFLGIGLTRIRICSYSAKRIAGDLFSLPGYHLLIWCARNRRNGLPLRRLR